MVASTAAAGLAALYFTIFRAARSFSTSENARIFSTASGMASISFVSTASSNRPRATIANRLKVFGAFKRQQGFNMGLAAIVISNEAVIAICLCQQTPNDARHFELVELVEAFKHRVAPLGHRLWVDAPGA